MCVCDGGCMHPLYMPNNERERPALTDGCGVKFHKCLSVVKSDQIHEWTYC